MIRQAADVGRRRQAVRQQGVMPESTFARIYQEMINFANGTATLIRSTMGTVPNVGLMAQQAEEYGRTTRPSRSLRTASPTSPTSPPARCC